MVSLSRDGREMNSETGTEQPVPEYELPNYSVPWKFIDNWIGVVLLIVIDLVIFIITLQSSKSKLAQSALIVILELAYLLPVILIFVWRGIPWKSLGFGKFSWSTLGIGCGLVVG